MDLLWFYIAVVLAISDELHSQLLWRYLSDFYILLAGFLQLNIHSNIRLWIAHEGMEAIFHFILLSIIFLSVEIGLLAAFIHFVVDFLHELFGLKLKWLQHRALHFTVESIFLIIVLPLLSL